MKITYDERSDTLIVILKDGPVAESDEQKPGVVLDYDESGDLISIEVLDASERMSNAREVVYETVPNT